MVTPINVLPKTLRRVSSPGDVPSPLPPVRVQQAASDFAFVTNSSCQICNVAEKIHFCLKLAAVDLGWSLTWSELHLCIGINCHIAALNSVIDHQCDFSRGGRVMFRDRIVDQNYRSPQNLTLAKGKVHTPCKTCQCTDHPNALTQQIFPLLREISKNNFWVSV